jgi:hypothetical protein
VRKGKRSGREKFQAAAAVQLANEVTMGTADVDHARGRGTWAGLDTFTPPSFISYGVSVESYHSHLSQQAAAPLLS